MTYLELSRAMDRMTSEQLNQLVMVKHYAERDAHIASELIEVSAGHLFVGYGQFMILIS